MISFHCLTSRFISKEIVLKFLKHYISNSNARSHADWKLMLMNNHKTHLIPEFIVLINDNHIRSYPLISHLTHCMQLLNVGVFQSYKHWHNKFIQEVIAELFIEYSINRFLQNLNKIRQNACKAKKFLFAFRKFEMWLINVQNCVQLFKKYNPDSLQISESQLSLLRQLNSLTAMKTSLDRWNEKIQKFRQWSDSLRANKFNEFITHLKEMSRFEDLIKKINKLVK